MKNKILQSMLIDNGRHSEIELGESLGLDEDQTRKIISSLLGEHKIEFAINSACEYKPFKFKTK